ncbi:MAG TPA: NAD(P)-dependent oxidoreductase [Terracidiphilus sp.]|nr:NAD(P)-dependent oxidoreductase [Terracidiphilus sp.]
MTLVYATGLGGFLGGHVEVALREGGFVPENLPRALRRSRDELEAHLRARPPAALIHMAGIVDVQYCRKFPLEAFEAHVGDTATLLEAMRRACPQVPVLYIATDKSFGEQQACGLTTPYQSGFPYEASKAAEDLLVESYAATYGMPIALLRFPNFFGEGDRHTERLIPSVCLAALEKREVVVRTRLDGTTRQYIYVRDAAGIILKGLQAVTGGGAMWRKSHFGPPTLKTVGDVIRDVENLMGERLEVKVLNQPGEVSTISLADENGLDFPYTAWLDALGQTLAWYRQHRPDEPAGR